MIPMFGEVPFTNKYEKLLHYVFSGSVMKKICKDIGRVIPKNENILGRVLFSVHQHIKNLWNQTPSPQSPIIMHNNGFSFQGVLRLLTNFRNI